MKNLLLVSLLIFCSLSIIANPNQFSIAHTNKSLKLSLNKDQKSGFDRTKVLVGGRLGANGGQRAFFINIAPAVGYALTNNFNVGASIGFSYLQQAVLDYPNKVTGKNETYSLKLPSYSMNVFARYHLANIGVIGIEPEISRTKFVYEETYNYNINSLKFNPNTGKLIEKSTHLTLPAVLVGAGLGQRLGDLGYYYTLVMYDLVQNPNSPYYQTLTYRVGMMFQLFPN